MSENASTYGLGQFGWVCSKCGRSYSPAVLECRLCNDYITMKECAKSCPTDAREQIVPYRLTNGGFATTTGSRDT